MAKDFSECNSSDICATLSITNYQASSAVKLEDSTYSSYWDGNNLHTSVMKPCESVKNKDDKSLRYAYFFTVARNFLTRPATFFTSSLILALRPDDPSIPRGDHTEYLFK